MSDLWIWLMLVSYLIVGLVGMVWLTDKDDKSVVSWSVMLSYHLVNLFFVQFLMTIAPDQSSGNGNPHIPYLLLSLVLFVWFCTCASIEAWKKLRVLDSWWKIGILLVSLLGSGVGLFLLLNLIETIRNQLDYPYTWWADMHFNSLYFSFPSYLLGLSLAILAASLFSWK
ncbi:hypothetical protein LCM20_17690 [Halobacillus litoralis]|uniref:hypothetical protein n=1 Tax=Halobacillus litoralis TaxID=45668 RepID=UPI001CD31012|nr:hypothetical protein [Halobacillus litoralis]MCA0972431.1 hypothetical protein [Halobacillus litoralis]